MLTEYFIRNSDNAIKLTLTEDGVPISGSWTALDVSIGTVTLHRSGDGDGLSLGFADGLLVIDPGDLLPAEITALAALQKGFQPVQIVVTSAVNDDGAVFGGSANDRIRFFVSDKP